MSSSLVVTIAVIWILGMLICERRIFFGKKGAYLLLWASMVIGSILILSLQVWVEDPSQRGGTKFPWHISVPISRCWPAVLLSKTEFAKISPDMMCSLSNLLTARTTATWPKITGVRVLRMTGKL